ncbi:hypothetical protein Tco_1406204 [Tanacetum coccineum]
MSNSKGSVNKGEIEGSSKKLKRKFKTMKGYEGDERIMFEFILKGFTESEIWDEVKESLSPKLNEDEYSICCENTTHMMNALKEARIKKLEDEKIKRNDKGKEKVNDFKKIGTHECLNKYNLIFCAMH